MKSYLFTTFWILKIDKKKSLEFFLDFQGKFQIKSLAFFVSTLKSKNLNLENKIENLLNQKIEEDEVQFLTSLIQNLPKYSEI